MRAVETVAQAQLAPRGERMVRGHHRADRLGDGLEHLEIDEVQRLEHQRQIAGEGAELVLGGRAVADADRKGHAGVVGPVAGDLRGQEDRVQRLAAGDGDMAAAGPRQVGDLAADPVEVGDLRADVLHQQLAGRVQPHAAGNPLENLGAELGLELLDAAVQRR